MKNARIVIAAAIAALAVGTGFAAAFTNPFVGPAKVAAVNGIVTVPLAKVSDGSAHKFRFESGGKTIVFFLVKGSDGKMHAAFDACDVCFHEHKGYEQQGGAVVCRNCGKKFAVNMIGSANTGGCNPSHLDFSISSGAVVIGAPALQAGARFF